MLKLNNAVLQAQIDSVTQMDRLTLIGDLCIANSSTLEVSFGNSFAPVKGNQYVLATVIGSISGEFSNYSEGDVVATFDDLAFEISYVGGASNTDIVLTAVEADGQVLLGDVNLDGQVNLLDVAPFVNLITSGQFQAEADCNEDGIVNLLDVALFVDFVIGM